jgi:outer membrane lipoprotein carrier protein
MMMGSRQLFFLSITTIFLVYTGTLEAAELDLGRLEKKYAEVGSIEADFTQEVYQATLARTKTSRGAITLSKPLLVRWETHAPERSVLVSNGIKIWYYTPEIGPEDKKGQVIVSPASELSKNPLIGILNGSIPVEKAFRIKSRNESDGLHTLELEPKKRMGDVKTAILEVGSNYLIKQIKLIHQSGNTTKISLQKVRLGAKLPTNLFKFSPPPGTQVVEGSK